MLLGEIFKAGDFSFKPYLIRLMHSEKDVNVLYYAIALFLAVGTHEDFNNSENLAFIAPMISFDSTSAFIGFHLYALSYEIVPYLLALLEKLDVELEKRSENSASRLLRNAL